MRVNKDNVMGEPEKEGRQEFCWNCRYAEQRQCESPCNTCFGNTPSGNYYAYKKWSEPHPAQEDI